MSAIEEQLLKIKHQAEEREAKRKAEGAGLEYLDLSLAPVETDALKTVPEEKARALQISPVRLSAHNLDLAVFNPENSELAKLLNELKAQNYILKIFVVSLNGLEHAWSFYKYTSPTTTSIHNRFDIEKDHLENLLKNLITFDAVAAEIHSFDFQKSPTGRILEIVLAGGLANRASDVHFEPEATHVKVRYRVDGILHDIVSDLAVNVYSQLLNRMKLLANLKLNLQHEPQDGRVTIGLSNKEIEIRLSVVPSEFGETVVMRLLDPDILKIGLKDLGLRSDDLVIIEEELKEPNGMILNSGPTGSGKTTTLYAFLRAKETPEIKIITIEDPIEYHLEGVEQTQVDEKGGYTFANGLRSIMRQDPDVILVGEIRDKETAEIGIQAALTGHLVFSTVHANDAVGVVPRLLDLGIKDTSIEPALNLIIAQRLVRKLCDSCKKPAELSPELKSKIENLISSLPARVDKSQYQEQKIFTVVGCEKCAKVGYKGRIGIYELLRVGTDKSPEVTVQQDGLLKVISGITTIQEIETVTGPIK